MLRLQETHSIRDLYSLWRDISYQMMSTIRYLQQLGRSLIGRLLMKESSFSLSIMMAVWMLLYL
uniref:Uncharacterized protein n=1 Tax=virus sp. ctx9V1 TaxID=2828001 RepID=A0A8S5RDP7_9VIRU|nr:MAG TPA: hypothetical protein [virus sp. ctx9V1]